MNDEAKDGMIKLIAKKEISQRRQRRKMQGGSGNLARQECQR